MYLQSNNQLFSTILSSNNKDKQINTSNYIVEFLGVGRNNYFESQRPNGH